VERKLEKSAEICSINWRNPFVQESDFESTISVLLIDIISEEKINRSFKNEWVVPVSRLE
jgi:hypothetical protein